VRVAFDATPAVVCEGGLRRYVEMLWPELAQRVELRAFALGRGGTPRNGLPLRRRHLPLRALEPLWQGLGWPRAESFTGPVDVVHATALVPPPTRAPLVVTVHDVLPLTHPHFFPPAAASMQRRQLDAAVRAACVLATCQATASEITRLAGVAPERIVVAPLGALPVQSEGPGDPAAEKHAAHSPFLLAVGALTPRKGFEVLARAAALLGPGCPEVLVAGGDGWNAAAVRRELAAADSARRLRLLGSVDDATLRRLYAQAAVVCVPSRAEGFGIPVLEAMALGAAVVASDLPSVREIAGPAATLVPAGDAAALAAALAALLDDPPGRDALGRAARERALGYTWARTADSVVAAYRLAAGARAAAG
jgi:glycosyltransferase involved in cell wall biosynthesis